MVGSGGDREGWGRSKEGVGGVLQLGKVREGLWESSGAQEGNLCIDMQAEAVA